MRTRAEALVDFAAATLPAVSRSRYREQWRADLRDASEVGLSSASIVWGAFRFASFSLSRALFESEWRASRSWIQFGIAVLTLLLPFHSIAGLLEGQSVVLRDQFDVYTNLMDSPITYVFPVVVVFLSCLRLFREVANRFAANTRTRARVESYLAVKAMLASGVAFVVFFAYAFLPFLMAFAVWPRLGDPSVSPGAYHLTAASALADSLTRTTYSSLLASGPMVYGVAYSAWVGFAAATIAAMCTACLVLFRSPGLAMAFPFIIVLAETIVAEIAGAPHATIVFSIFPFGLTQTSVFLGALPVLILAVLVAAAWANILRSARTSEIFT